MKHTRLLSWLVVGVVGAAACTGPADTPLSPSGAEPASAALNPDGSNLKVSAPSGLSPNGGFSDSLRPTLFFTPGNGVYVSLGAIAHELEVQNGNGTVVYSRIIEAGATSHGLQSDLTYADTFWYRFRGRIGDDAGPWSGFAEFRTPDPPTPVAPPPTAGGGAGLPFPVPAECGPGDPSNRFGCVAAIAALSVEWQGCAGGAGTRCHRFTRQVVYAMSLSDPNWKMIQAAPGGHACNCFSCGPSDGSMFREDTTVYGGNRVYDMIIGAGGPTPSLNWSFVGAPRNVDGPGDAPLCNP